ncbi:hypothetical protein KPB2_5355 [Klebsiella pneumoniae Kb677]|nr:hypothetical protein KPB2_5355 [Klebsiella pneumoniae Kb677]
MLLPPLDVGLVLVVGLNPRPTKYRCTETPNPLPIRVDARLEANAVTTPSVVLAVVRPPDGALSVQSLFRRTAKDETTTQLDTAPRVAAVEVVVSFDVPTLVTQKGTPSFVLFVRPRVCGQVTFGSDARLRV